jgi:CRISPR/Cas system CSM-associated protein Csm2 small subunit
MIRLGNTHNTGIECYILEIICSTEIRKQANETFIIKWANILSEDIIRKAISFRNRLFWRWEKNPARSDYCYPLDWDDTFKAIDAIKAYARCFGKNRLFRLPNIKLIQELIEKTIYHSNSSGQEIKLKCKNDSSLYMFITDIENKKNNTEDIVVTSVVIRSLLINYKNRSGTMDDIIIRLLKKIIEIMEIGIKDKIPLMYLSRCYFSWGLLLMLLNDIKKYVPTIEERVSDNSKKYIEQKLYIKALPKEFYDNLIIDELNYAKIIALRLGMYKKEIYNMDRDYRIKKSDNPQIMYRHRSLGHFYGSKKWSNILDQYVKSRVFME